MKKEVKIILFPEEHKSKNGAFFENLIRNIFETQRYDIIQNINYTGLEIDLQANHKDRNETVYIECKAKEKPKSTELKNFAFNVNDRNADYGYFVYTEELDHQAAGLREEWKEKDKYKNISFFGPDKIIDVLIETTKITPFDAIISDISQQFSIYKLTLAYTYFGLFYLIIPYDNAKRTDYFLFDAKTGKQILDVLAIADKEHSEKISIHNALKSGINELDKLKHLIFDKNIPAIVPSISNDLEIENPKDKVQAFKPNIAFLIPEPIDKNFNYDIYHIIDSFDKYDISLDFDYLSEGILSNMDNYDYIFIFTETYKNKLYVEDENLKSHLLSIADFESSLLTDSDIIKGIFIFTEEELNFDDIDTDKPIVNFVLAKKGLANNTLKNIIHCLFQEKQLKDKFKHHSLNENCLKLQKLAKSTQRRKIDLAPKLPDSIDTKDLQNFIGREIDQENIIKRILQLQHSEKVLTIKGAGGLGKTTITKKVVIELAKRKYFKDGIEFIECEKLTNFGSFESKLASCFDMDNVVNLKEHLRDYPKFDKLVILDNFETLLTLDEKTEADKIKNLVSFICEYAIILITSRQKIGYDFEEVYPLMNFSTDDALALFKHFYSFKKSSEQDEKLLRSEILENLLNNNPLAIKIITKNLPQNKEINFLKKELEENFFTITNEDFEEIAEVYDKEADTNIERTRSLFDSINYSYKKLDAKEKLAFELLSLFPDGIHLENFKKCFNPNSKEEHKVESINNITDRQIKGLEDKSLVENSKGMIKLQSIVARFADYQFNKRTEQEKSRYFEDAFSYNDFMIYICASLALTHKEKFHLKFFNNISNNILKSLDYINFNEECDDKLRYIGLLESFIYDENQTKKLIEKIYILLDKNSILSDKQQLFLKIISLHNKYFTIEFSSTYEQLVNLISFEKVFQLDFSSFPDENSIVKALNIYDMEGASYQIIYNIICKNIHEFDLSTEFFRSGLYNTFKRLNDIASDFIYYEWMSNNKDIDLLDLKEYIKRLYAKEHLEKLQCHYILAKNEPVERDIIKKLVVTNPYTAGLKSIMYALIEEDLENKIDYFEDGIEKLFHIKYYYIEGIYLYCKFLKEIKHSDYQEWFDKGYELAKSYYYQFLKHQFVNLNNGTDEIYNEENYPLPDKLDFDTYLEEFNRHNSDDEDKKHKKVKNITQNLPANHLVYVEGETDALYINKAIELFNKHSLRLEVKWIGTLDNKGNAINTGDTALNNFAAHYKAHPEDLKQKTTLLYDSDTRKPIENHGKLYIRCMPINEENVLYKKGIENLLNLPDDFLKDDFYKTFSKEKTDDYGGKEVINREVLDKTKLCNWICNSLEQSLQKEYLQKFIQIFDGFC